MKHKWNDYISKEQLRKRGYNLESSGVLDISHFDSLDDAIDDFCNGALNQLYELITKYKSRAWADAFLSDMARNDLTNTIALEYQELFKDALIEQIIYVYDNGDSSANSDNQDRKDRSPYSPKAVEKLWDRILTH